MSSSSVDRSPAAAAAPLPVPSGASPQAVDWTARWPGTLLLWAGWLVPQVLLLGPALVGRTVDMPVDFLATPSIYLPQQGNFKRPIVRHGTELSDLVFSYPPARKFVAAELRAGRLPLWNPHNFAGAPIVGGAFSPLELPYDLFPTPVTVAWMFLLPVLFVGTGMWTFLRRCLELSYWPAALASWCAPLTGFMTLWHGFSTLGPACWLPWLLVAIDGTVKRPRGWGGPSVALLTTLVLVGGHIGMAGLVLLTSGLYALWLLAEAARERDWRRVRASVAELAGGWVLGFAIAAPVLVPLLAYIRTGSRVEAHAAGVEERPPEGLVALPAIVRPDVYGGKTRANWARTVSSGLLESSSSAYAGLLAALWLAPLAWCHRRLRSKTIFLTLLVIVSLGWILKIPGIIDLERSRPLQPLLSLSYNRWSCATGTAILILAAIGLDAIRIKLPVFRWTWAAPIFVTALFGGWCVYRLFTLTRKLDEAGLASGFVLGIVLSLVALGGWATTFRGDKWLKWVRIALIAVLPLELIGFAWAERRQADRELFYPRVPILEQLAALPRDPERVWGVSCLPPSLNLMCGLDDIRGYDAVDPQKFIKLIELACDRERTFYYVYARTLAALPAGRVVDHTLKLHPVANLLNVRYLIFRDPPRADLPILLHQDDYWIMENRDALPRAYVPSSARVVADDDEALAQMAKLDFDPRQTVYLADDVHVPQHMRGTASVFYETPTRVRLDVDMQTDGLVLLSDLWDPGWHATLDGDACPIYRADVALRGFRVPTGKHTLVCTYEPASLRTGLLVGAAGVAVLLVWGVWKTLANRRLPPA